MTYIQELNRLVEKSNQREVANALNIPQGYLSRVLSRKTYPGIKLAMTIADVTEMDVRDVIEQVLSLKEGTNETRCN